MTESSAGQPAVILDTTCLSHFARAERLDVLCDLLIARDCWTTEVVLDELTRGVPAYPMLAEVAAQDWLNVARLDSPNEIMRFATWARRAGSGERDLGEASVFAAAELHSAIAVSDDRNAVRVARAYGVSVHGTI